MGYVILVYFLLLSPLLQMLMTPRLKASSHPNKRIANYAFIITELVVMATIAALVMQDKTLQSPFGSQGIITISAGVAICVGLVLVMGKGLPQVLKSPELRVSTHKQFAVLDYMLPQTRAERKWFFIVCLCAGVCEEIIFRGFMVRFFMEAPFGWMAVVAAVASCTVFGLNHLYQGWQGMLATGLTGAFFTLILFAFGSLIPAIVIHVLIDLRVLAFTLPNDHPLLLNAPVQAEASSEAG